MTKESQAKIEEIIRENNVNANWEAAMENNPEVFGSVTMLYVDSEVNRVPMKAFIDCGAQMTVMTVATAERCGIMRLVDRRFAGMAKGVGSAPIVGRVHSCDLKIGNSVFPCSFTVMEQGGHDFLLGLDMLKRFQAVVDLRSNTLSIGDEVIPFLGEGDVPMDQRVGAGGGAVGGCRGPSQSALADTRPRVTKVGVLYCIHGLRVVFSPDGRVHSQPSLYA